MSKKAILYVRVSTDEQADKGHSLAHQEEQLRRYCLHNNIEVTILYREDHSAKTFERPQFKTMIEAVKKKQVKASLLLFLKWDRFSRNAPEAYNMISQLNKLGIEPQGIEQPLNLEIPEQKFLLALYLTAPEVENDRRSMNTIAGMRKAMKEGRYLGLAPFGYSHSRNEHNRPCIVPSPEEAKWVQLAYEMMSTGQYAIDELGRILRDKGMRLPKSRFAPLLRNVTYIGKIQIQGYKQESAEVVRAVHDPIISEVLFYKVQDALDGRSRTQSSTALCQREELPLRGYLECPQCRRLLTGSGSKGRGGVYYYYHCTAGCRERVKAPHVNDCFLALLSEVSAQKKLLRSLALIMSNTRDKDSKQSSHEMTLAKRELEGTSKRLHNAQMLMLDGSLDAEEYKAIKAKLVPERDKLTSRIVAIEGRKDNLQEIIEFGAFYLSNLEKLFIDADLSLKRRIVGSTFPEKLVFLNGALRTTKPHQLFTLIGATSAGFGKNKMSSQRKTDCSPRIGRNMGLEPTTLGTTNQCSNQLS